MSAYTDSLMTKALKTRDPNTLFLIVQESINAIKDTEASLAFSRMREKKLQEQVKRQADIIDNLNKTLWK